MGTSLFSKELLRPDEVAGIFRVCIKTVYNWCDEGIIESKKIKGVMRITTTSVQSILNTTINK